jgi:HD superfamily phosphohydrolase
MYQQVYHHKATRAAEALVRAIFQRIAELSRQGELPDGVPSALARAIVGERVSLGEYLALDDVLLLSCMKKLESGPDAILSELTARVSRRELPKTLPLPQQGPRSLWDAALDRARDVALEAGLRPELMVQLDVPEDVPFSESDTDAAGGLWVTIRHQPLQPLGEASFLLGHLRNQRIERPRLIFPEAIRERVLQALEPLLG